MSYIHPSCECKYNSNNYITSYAFKSLMHNAVQTASLAEEKQHGAHTEKKQKKFLSLISKWKWVYNKNSLGLTELQQEAKTWGPPSRSGFDSR